MSVNQSGTMSLAELNSEEMSKHVGGIIFVSFLMIIGLIGNIHVLIVFGMKMKPSNHRTFICLLAVLDLISCSIGMPFILVDLTHPLTFNMTTACKILRMLNYFICACSVFTMLVASADRYRKVCQPLGWQFSDKTTKLACGIFVLIAAGISWPALILFGNASIKTEYVNITGVGCSTDDKYIHTKYQSYFNTALIVIAMGTLVVHVVLYSLICRVIKNHSLNKLQIKQTKLPRPSAIQESVVSITDISVNYAVDLSSQVTENCDKRANEKQHIVSSSCTNGSPRSVKLPNCSQNGCMHVKNQLKMFRETRRVTVVLFAIVAIFFISYIPHLILKLAVYSQDNFLGKLSTPGLLLYNTFIWCFFINNVANPIVYLFLDIKFRAEVMSYYRHLFLV